MVSAVGICPLQAKSSLNAQLYRPQHSSKGLQPDELKLCMELSERGVVCANWLASAAQVELSRFREFMLWLRCGEHRFDPYNADTRPYHADSCEETSPAPTEPNTFVPQKHDLLDVCEYLDSGLMVSPIDKWFIGGGPPALKLNEIPKPAVEGVRSAVTKARASLKQGLKWPPVSPTLRC